MSRKNDLQRLIATSSRRLQLLKEKKAILGITADPSIDIQIETIETEIEELRDELEGIEEDEGVTITGKHSQSREQYQVVHNWAQDGRRANLYQFDLSGADLQAIDLVGAKMSRADLSKANLYMADLHRADLRMANLSEAKLIKTNLSKANLQEAKLCMTNLTETNLYLTNLRGADLTGAELNWSRLKDIRIDYSTKIDTRWRRLKILNGAIRGMYAGAFLGALFSAGFTIMYIMSTMPEIVKQHKDINLVASAAIYGAICGAFLLGILGGISEGFGGPVGLFKKMYSN